MVGKTLRRGKKPFIYPPTTPPSHDRLPLHLTVNHPPPSHHVTPPLSFHPSTQNAPPLHIPALQPSRPIHLFNVFCFSASTLTSLTSSPFLLLTLELKRRRVHSILSERNGGVEIAVLISAAAHCIDAAKAIVNLCDSLFSLGIAVEVSPPPFLFSTNAPRLQSC